MHYPIFSILILSIAILTFSGCTLGSSSDNTDIPPLEITDPTSKDNESPYTISEHEEKDFLEKVSRTLSRDRLLLITKDLQQLKHVFPEGYFVVLNIGSAFPEEVNTYYNTSLNNKGSRMNLLIHELSHIASGACEKDTSPNNSRCTSNTYTFLKDYTQLVVPYQPDTLHTKEVLRESIDTLTGIDETYLNEKNGDVYGTLDELNAYTKSLRAQIAYTDIDSIDQLYFEYNNLHRQLLHLALGLDYARKNNEEEWKYLTNNAGISYTIFNFKKDAEKELSRVNIEEANAPIETISQAQNTQKEIKKYKDVYSQFFDESIIREGEKALLYTDGLKHITINTAQLK